MEYLHTMVRVTDLEKSLEFYRDKLGLIETRRVDNEAGRFTLVFLAAGAFADEHPACLPVAHPGDCLLAAFAQHASVTRPHVGLEGGPVERRDSCRTGRIRHRHDAGGLRRPRAVLSE